MFTHYGCITNKWFPAKSHGALTAADLMRDQPGGARAVSSSKLLIPRGIRAMNEWTRATRARARARTGQRLPHLQVAGSYFTLPAGHAQQQRPVQLRHGDKFNAKPVGSSLDHVMAQQLSPHGTPLFMTGRQPERQRAVGDLLPEIRHRRERPRRTSIPAPARRRRSSARLTGLFEQRLRRCPPTPARRSRQEGHRPREGQTSKTSSART